MTLLELGIGLDGGGGGGAFGLFDAVNLSWVLLVARSILILVL